MNETLTRADICNVINKKLGFSVAESAEMLDAVLDEMATGLKKEGLVKLTGFGNFVTRSKNKRVGRNPKTNKEAVISARKAVAFNASNLLKKKVNSWGINV